MKKINPCQCQLACQTKRCACLKQGRPCTSECQCENCNNPFNSIENADRLSDCARQNINNFVALSDSVLEKKYELPCGCTSHHSNLSLKITPDKVAQKPSIILFASVR